MLMNEKQFYTSPEVDVLVVRFEEDFLTGSKTASGNSIPGLTEEYDDWN